MGFGTILIGVVLLLIVLAYFGSSLGTFFNDIKVAAQARADANAQKLPTYSGEQICDLKVIIYGQVVEDGFPPTIKVKFGDGTPHPEIVNRSWLNCDTPTKMSLLDFGELPAPFPLAIFVTDEKFHIEGVLRDSKGYKMDATIEPSLYKYIDLKAGITPTPLNFEKTFIINNVGKHDYTFDVYVGRQIIGKDTGEPITVKIRG